jgi:hypothetical protein
VSDYYFLGGADHCRECPNFDERNEKTWTDSKGIEFPYRCDVVYEAPTQENGIKPLPRFCPIVLSGRQGERDAK